MNKYTLEALARLNSELVVTPEYVSATALSPDGAMVTARVPLGWTEGTLADPALRCTVAGVWQGCRRHGVHGVSLDQVVGVPTEPPKFWNPVGEAQNPYPHAADFSDLLAWVALAADADPTDNPKLARVLWDAHGTVMASDNVRIHTSRLPAIAQTGAFPAAPLRQALVVLQGHRTRVQWSVAGQVRLVSRAGVAVELTPCPGGSAAGLNPTWRRCVPTSAQLPDARAYARETLAAHLELLDRVAGLPLASLPGPALEITAEGALRLALPVATSDYVTVLAEPEVTCSGSPRPVCCSPRYLKDAVPPWGATVTIQSGEPQSALLIRADAARSAAEPNPEATFAVLMPQRK